MKWIKKYSFFFMLLVSGICYGTGKVIKTAEVCQGQRTVSVQEQEKQPEIGAQAGGTVQSSERQPVEAENTEEPAEQEQPVEAENTEEPAQQEPTEQDTDVPDPEGPKEFRRVELDYMDDALFIGDSRTSTLYEYAGWDQTDFFVKYGLTIWDVWDQTMEGRSLADMLAAKQYGKIYIMLGVNELGNGTAESYREQFESVVAQLREKQPEAVIFVEAILHVTGSKDAEGTYINNGEINARNQELKKLADQKQIFYLDANEVMDEPGAGVLNGEYSFDGVHLKVKYIPVWRDYLLEHGI